MEKDKIERISTQDKIAGFLQRNRKILLALIILTVGGIISSVAYFSIKGVLEKKAIAKVEVLERRKNELGTVNDASNSADIETLRSEINKLASSSFGYAASRAYSLEADIYFSRSEWDKAEETWILAAKKAPKIYLASVALFNAAVAAEEQGKREAAIDYFNQSLAFPGVYPAASRARFNIGRINEEQGNKEKAKEAYRELIEKSPDSPWANLAQNRLIILDKN